MAIHPTAVLDPHAQLASDVDIGPYAVIGPHVSIDSGTRVGAHTVIEGRTQIGKRNRIFQFASLGAAPQDKKYGGEPTQLVIGDDNTIREFCTFNIGTVQDRGVTQIGNQNWIMAYVHIAHDCLIGDQTILANNTTLAGHVDVGDWALLGGLTAIHQFCTIGPHAMSAGGSIIVQDVPPYVTVAGNHAAPVGINAEGMKRRGFDSDQIRRVRQAYKHLYRESRSFEDARVLIVAEAEQAPELQLFEIFFEHAKRGVVR